MKLFLARARKESSRRAGLFAVQYGKAAPGVKAENGRFPETWWFGSQGRARFAPHEFGRRRQLRARVAWTLQYVRAFDATRSLTKLVWGRHFMSRLLASCAAVALLGGTAFAADLPVPAYDPPAMQESASLGYDWTGFYFGVFGGYGWGDYSFDYNVPDVGDNTDGWLAGGEIGGNLQFGPMVIGAEADIALTGIDGSNSCPTATFNCDTEINWFSTVRGRVGVAASRFHVFGTGGLAIADVRGETVHLPGAAVPPSGTPINGEDNVLYGWTAGGGVEVMFGAPTNRWTVKADWLYYDLDEEPFGIDTGQVVDVGHDGHMVRLHVTKLLP